MKGLRCLPGERPGRGSLISERKELKAGEGGGCGERLPPSPALLGSLMPPSPAPRWVFPGSIQAGGESGAGQTLGLWWLSSWESPACSDFTLLSNFLAFARELGACSEPAPCVCVGGVGGERLWLSPGGLKSQLEEGGKRKIKAARFSGPHIFSQACGSSSEGVCGHAWRGCVCATHTYVEMLWRCARPGGIRTLGYAANPCSDSKSEVSLAAPACAGCSRVLCRRGRALVQGEQGQRAQPKWGFASYLRISLLRCRSQASQGAQSHPACQPPRTLQDSSLSSLPFPRRHSLCSVSSPSEGNTPPWPRYVYPK